MLNHYFSIMKFVKKGKLEEIMLKNHLVVVGYVSGLLNHINLITKKITVNQKKDKVTKRYRPMM